MVATCAIGTMVIWDSCVTPGVEILSAVDTGVDPNWIVTGDMAVVCMSDCSWRYYFRSNCYRVGNMRIFRYSCRYCCSGCNPCLPCLIGNFCIKFSRNELIICETSSGKAVVDSRPVISLRACWDEGVSDSSKVSSFIGNQISRTASVRGSWFFRGVRYYIDFWSLSFFPFL